MEKSALVKVKPASSMRMAVYKQVAKVKLRVPGAELTLHHNHSLDVSLSSIDIGLLSDSPGLGWIWAHGQDGGDYGARLLPGWS